MQVKGYSLTLHQYPGVNRTLYAHQVAMVDTWNTHDAFLLVTKTGSGKTAASALPVLLQAKKVHEPPEGAVFVYPTNALIQDQERSIRQLIESEDMHVVTLGPENVREKLGHADIVLVRIDADRLDKFARSYGFRKPDGTWDKSKALNKILVLDKPKIVLTNPDILYLIYALAYRHSAESVALLQGYQTLVFDEFHLYGGIELAHAFFLIHLARSLHAFKRVILLSATPDVQTKQWIDKLLSPIVIDSSTVTTRPIVGERVVAHDIDLAPISNNGNVVRTLCASLLELQPILNAKRLENKNEDYVPAVIILNSVIQAIELEDMLVQSGFLRDSIAPIRGLSSQALRTTKDKLLVIGTSAIEVGIDFQCDYVLFEAGDAASFLQRFGRGGRHQPGKAILFESNRIVEALNFKTHLTRSELESLIYSLYENRNARAWFVGTKMGLITAFSQAYRFQQRIEATWYADANQVASIENWMDQVLEDYAERIEVTSKLIGVRKIFKESKQGNRLFTWLKDYLAIDTFRTSLPSTSVYDLIEAERRGKEFAKFDVDIYTLIRRARSFYHNETTGDMVVSGGWEHSHHVYLNQSFYPEDCYCIMTTRNCPDMVLFRDGQITSVSRILVTPKPHIFAVFPKKVRELTDWRMAVFPSGDHIVVFDGDALLLLEMWKRLEGVTAVL